MFYATVEAYTMHQEALVAQLYASEERQVHRLYYRYKAQEPPKFMMGREQTSNYPSAGGSAYGNDPFGNYPNLMRRFEDFYEGGLVEVY